MRHNLPWLYRSVECFTETPLSFLQDMLCSGVLKGKQVASDGYFRTTSYATIHFCDSHIEVKSSVILKRERAREGTSKNFQQAST